MDAMQFEQQARQDPHLSIFLKDIAEDTAQQISVFEPQRFVTVTGVDLLFSLAAYALYRWAKDFFDHRRALNEITIAEQQAQLIKDLVDDGFPLKDAQATADALFKRIAKRTEDDPALKTVRTLIGKGK